MTPPSLKVGLLPLYLTLYDERLPAMRAVLEPFLHRVAAQLRARALAVEVAPVCRTRGEFASAIQRFEGAGCDAIVTLHLAYSPSLESVDALAASRLPIVMCDVTPDARFDATVDPIRLLYNHGVHGVQDLANLLRRRGKPFAIAAGHVEEAAVFDRVGGLVRGAAAGARLRRVRTLRIGEPFPGMGDFAVGDEQLHALLGHGVEQASIAALREEAGRVSDAEIDDECRADAERFVIACPGEAHRRANRVGLALRRLIARRPFDAFSFNFQIFDSAEAPIDTVPMLEASKAMARGVGYAGEGDVLTAALTGALARTFGQTTFTEIFCPDWAGQSLFLSHMGEVNVDLAAGRPTLLEKDFPWTGCLNPAIAVCGLRAGAATLVNLAPQPGGRFALLAAEVDVLEDTRNDLMRREVRGWIRPRGGVGSFLEAYSRAGGTHHKALVYGSHAAAMQAMADAAGLDCVIL